MKQLIPALVFYLLVLVLCLARPGAGRLFVGVFFLIMAVGVNVVLVLSAPDQFVALGTDASLVPLYHWFFESIVASAPAQFGLLAATYEAAVGLLILRGGRYARLGLVGGIVFLIGTTPLGVWTLANPLMAAAMAYLLTREYDRSLPEVLRPALRSTGGRRADRAYRHRPEEDAARENGTVLEDVMPAYEFADRATVHVDAPAEATMRAFRKLTLAEATPPLVRAMIFVRYLPGRILGKERGNEDVEGSRSFLETLSQTGTVVLDEERGREVVVGTIGRFHNLFDQQPAPIRGREDFSRFADPGYQKLAMGLRATDQNGGCELVFEHRTHALSPSSRRRFALYWWLVIKPASAFMVRMLLRAIKRRAEDASR